MTEDHPPMNVEALIAAYAGPPRRPVRVRAKALVMRYLALRGIDTPDAARQLGIEDAAAAPRVRT